ncbi:hypothetical protein IEN85_21010 [Pelagicoccus sp. NFK12]|uniref:Curli production assembly/transport component CsgG n=1 Tax=Pelagicoccus enzymogenes TaxID=2773457 RepID=A0A927IH83_9BACT|nr:CsgG/HfaB family protein [Pelagicoccus enzymogenes]MBD5781992.1 hypothetical protein [Pelagicoccus enzymogenes]
MTSYRTLITLAACGLLATASHAQRKTIGIAEIQTNDAVEANAQSNGYLDSLNLVRQSLKDQVITALNQTRKFEIVARTDLDSVMKEMDLQNSGLVTSPQANEVAAAEYLLDIDIDSFQDYKEEAEFKNIGKAAKTRIIRFSVIAKIYDLTQGGKLIESVSVQRNERKMEKVNDFVQGDGELSDVLMRDISASIAQEVSNKVADRIFPPRVIAISDDQATINRGEGTGIAVGQIWKAYALGEEMIDFDTGENLGREETEVGTIEITQVLPKFAKGKVLADFGIERGQVSRPYQPQQ